MAEQQQQEQHTNGIAANNGEEVVVAARDVDTKEAQKAREKAEVVKKFLVLHRTGALPTAFYQVYFRHLAASCVSNSFAALHNLLKFLQRFNKKHARESDNTKQRLALESSTFADTIEEKGTAYRVAMRPLINEFAALGFDKKCAAYVEFSKQRAELLEVLAGLHQLWKERDARKTRAATPPATPANTLIQVSNAADDSNNKKAPSKKKAASAASRLWSDDDYACMLETMIVEHEYYAAQIDAYKAACTNLKAAVLEKIGSKEFVGAGGVGGGDGGAVGPLVASDDIIAFIKARPELLATKRNALGRALDKRNQPAQTSAQTTGGARQQPSPPAQRKSAPKRKSEAIEEKHEDIDDDGDDTVTDGEDITNNDTESSDEYDNDDDSKESLLAPTQILECREEIVDAQGNKVVTTSKRSRVLRPRKKRTIERIAKHGQKLEQNALVDSSESFNPDEDDDAGDGDDVDVIDGTDSQDADDDDDDDDDEPVSVNDEDEDDLDVIGAGGLRIKRLPIDNDDEEQQEDGDDVEIGDGSNNAGEVPMMVVVVMEMHVSTAEDDKAAEEAALRLLDD